VCSARCRYAAPASTTLRVKRFALPVSCGNRPAAAIAQPAEGIPRLIASRFNELVSKADWVCEDRLVASRHPDQPELSEPA